MAITSFSRLITRLAEQDPERIAITCGANTISRSELDLSTNRLARAYQALGVRADDFVTIALPNSIEFMQASIALWKLGAIPQPVSARLPVKELQSIITLAKPRLTLGIDPDLLPDITVLPAGFVPDSHLSDQSLEDRTATCWKAPTSGGSTGKPKLIVAHSPSELDPEHTSVLRLQPDRVAMIPGPLYHNGPFHFAAIALMLGNHLVIGEKFDALRCLQDIEQYEVDWIFMVPTMMQRIARLDSAQRDSVDLSSLRILLHAAAPCPAWLKNQWINWLGADVIHELYGGTENTGTTWITGAEWLTHQGSVGKILAGSQIKIINDDGEPASIGEKGLVYFLPDTGQGSTYHYIGAEPDAIVGGWETLGDIGYQDKDGYLYLCDRKKDMILSGGVNIYPAEVEAAIESHPRVRSAIVVGVPDEDLGQKVHAVVDAPEGVARDKLIEFLSDELVRYKVPRSFEFVNQPLRDEAGKARRSLLVQ